MYSFSPANALHFLTQGQGTLKNRVVPEEVIVRYKEKITSLEPDIKAVLKEEAEESEV